LLTHTHRLVSDCGFQYPYAVILRSSFFKPAVEAAACQMTRSEALPFPCPDFVCPVDAIRLGYPWIEMSDYRADANARNGFAPVAMTQSPPPGSIFRYDSTIPYTIVATDAANRTESCTSQVLVPPLTACGTVQLTVAAAGQQQQQGGGGASRIRAPFVPVSTRTIIVATVYKMKGILQSRLRGRGAATARLTKGGDKLTGGIRFRGNKTEGSLNSLAVEEPFTYYNASEALQVDLQVRDNANPANNVARFDVYCQEVLGE
jgi:hypothetical protein